MEGKILKTATTDANHTTKNQAKCFCSFALKQSPIFFIISWRQTLQATDKALYCILQFFVPNGAEQLSADGSRFKILPPSFPHTSARMAWARPVKLGWKQIGLFSKRITESYTIRVNLQLSESSAVKGYVTYEAALWDWVTTPSIPNLKQLKQVLCPRTMQTADLYLWKALWWLLWFSERAEPLFLIPRLNWQCPRSIGMTCSITHFYCLCQSNYSLSSSAPETWADLT